MTRRYILTGTPGSGKTTILSALRDRGHRVVEEAATDIINTFDACGVAEPWRRADFIDRIIALQRERQVAADAYTADDTIFDRSPVCTLALSVYLQRPASAALLAELDRIARARIYDRRVFFVHNIGFVAPTAARRITYAESLTFERIHLDTYRDHGYDIVDVEPGPVADRVAAIEDVLGPVVRPPAPGCPGPAPGTGR
jgi:predicted ATPase